MDVDERGIPLNLSPISRKVLVDMADRIDAGTYEWPGVRCDHTPWTPEQLDAAS